MKTAIYIRPSEREIEVGVGPGTEAYAKANNWVKKIVTRVSKKKAKNHG